MYKLKFIAAAIFLSFALISCENFLDSVVDDDNEKYVESSELPQSILDYIDDNYPDDTIVEAELDMDDDYYEVELSNGWELYFDLNGNFLKKEMDDDWDDDDRDDHYDKIDPSELPQIILDYIDENYSDVTILYAEKDLEDNEFEVKLSNGWELYFNLDGNFLKKERD